MKSKKIIKTRNKKICLQTNIKIANPNEKTQINDNNDNKEVKTSISKFWNYSIGGQVRLSPALGDINNDGKLEIFAGSLDNLVYDLNARGQLLKRNLQKIYKN